jgi:hypothetical protein
VSIGVRANLVGGQNSTFSGVFYVTDNAGNAVTLTSYTAEMKVRASYGATTSLLDLLSTGGSPPLVINASAGSIAVTISATQMQSLPVVTNTTPPANQNANIPPSTIFVYDLIITSPSGVVTRVFFGSFTVSASVTHT